MISSIPKSIPQNRLVTSRVAENDTFHFILPLLYEEAQRTELYNVVSGEVPQYLTNKEFTSQAGPTCSAGDVRFA